MIIKMINTSSTQKISEVYINPDHIISFERSKELEIWIEASGDNFYTFNYLDEDATDNAFEYLKKAMRHN